MVKAASKQANKPNKIARREDRKRKMKEKKSALACD